MRKKKPAFGYREIITDKINKKERLDLQALFFLLCEVLSRTLSEIKNTGQVVGVLNI